MSKNELIARIENLKELEALAAELDAEISALKDSIKKHMDSIGVAELEAGPFVARFTVIVSNRLDTTALKRENAAMYHRYLKQCTSRRFSIT